MENIKGENWICKN